MADYRSLILLHSYSHSNMPADLHVPSVSYATYSRLQMTA